MPTAITYGGINRLKVVASPIVILPRLATSGYTPWILAN
jgi:hypothetical protein